MTRIVSKSPVVSAARILTNVVLAVVEEARTQGIYLVLRLVRFRRRLARLGGEAGDRFHQVLPFTGFETWPLQPAFRLWAAAPESACAVRATIGTTCRGSRASQASISRVAAQPSITGIWISIKTRSYSPRRRFSNTSMPFE